MFNPFAYDFVKHHMWLVPIYAIGAGVIGGTVGGYLIMKGLKYLFINH